MRIYLMQLHVFFITNCVQAETVLLNLVPILCMYLMNSGLEFLVQDLRSKYLPPAYEVWGQGNAFTPVCLFAGGCLHPGR